VHVYSIILSCFISKQSDYDAPEVTMRTRRVLYESDDSAIVVRIVWLSHWGTHCFNASVNTRRRQNVPNSVVCGKQRKLKSYADVARW